MVKPVAAMVKLGLPSTYEEGKHLRYLVCSSKDFLSFPSQPVEA